MVQRKLSFLLVGLSLLICNSCIDRDQNYYERMPQEAYFDFNLNQEVTLSVDYGFNSDEYVVLFEIYDQNPLVEKEDGTKEKNEGIEPLFRAATDGSGKYSGDIQMLTNISEVWLYSDYLGTISPVKLKVQNQTITFNQKAYLESFKHSGSQVRATSPNNKYPYPDNWLILGDWDQYGTPDYMESELASPPPSVLYSILDTYTSINNKQITTRYPEFFNGKMSSDVRIIKPTKVRLVFINSSAGWDNAVGYFTYPTDQKPTSVKDIKRILAFPNASPLAKSDTKRGALLCGNQVQLKYWDGERFHDEFPAGVSIGWWLEGMGFRGNGELKEVGYTRFSLNELNFDGKQRTVALRDKDSDQIVAVGFEDNIDQKFNDASFYLDIEEKDAIDTDTPVLPPVDPPSNQNNSTQYQGTLTFEDLWPSLGDYDMNDVMLTYKSTVYKTIVGNLVNKIVDEFTIYHNGGTFQNGFGYQFHKLLPSDIRSVKIEGKAKSRYMEGQVLEPGQTHPTILLFDDVHDVIGETFTVTLELNDVKDLTKVTPPYNPFIFSISNESRGKEVHLSKYPPTDKANYSYFGTESDGSRPEDDLFYVASHFWYQYPFALNLPIINFPIPAESRRIDAQYPKFRSWADSSGAKDNDWYKYPQK